MTEVRQGLLKLPGVVLKRRISPEGDVSLYLFLKEAGPVYVQAPGASRGRVRFGGAIEPLVWAAFNLYRGERTFYLKSADIKEDFWGLRGKTAAINRLLEWDGLLCRHLVPGLQCDEVLTLFYRSGLLLKEGVHPLVVEWRFLWKWLNEWGIAPSLDICGGCGSRLTSAQLGTSGLHCPSCSRSSGQHLSEEMLEQLRESVSLPARKVVERFHSEGFASAAAWREADERIRQYFSFL